jgi:hypothetical protein
MPTFKNHKIQQVRKNSALISSLLITTSWIKKQKIEQQ